MDQKRFDELVGKHQVPGAVLAVSVGGELREYASGVLNLRTGVETTTDSLFQLASITKPYTATMVMRLVEQGAVTLDTPIAEVLPGFRVADPDVTARVTLRHVLSHTSGISGDFYLDTGRGDDALERFVAGCADLGQDVPLGATFSYSNAGYNIAGRVVEVLTGQVWDQALRDLVLDPLGVEHTFTFPEHMLTHRVAAGHHTPEGQEQPVAVWDAGFRSRGPSGGISATAADVIALARMHMTDPVLAPSHEPQVALAYPMIDHWGLGWMLWNWGGQFGFGHGGDRLGQSSHLRVVPDKDFAAVVLTNSNTSIEMMAEVFAELQAEHCGIEARRRPEPPATPWPLGDPDRYVGAYTRVGGRIEISAADGLRLRYVPEGPIAASFGGYEFDLTPVSDRLFVGRASDTGLWSPVVFEGDYIHMGVRAYRKA